MSIHTVTTDVSVYTVERHEDGSMTVWSRSVDGRRSDGFSGQVIGTIALGREFRVRRVDRSTYNAHAPLLIEPPFEPVPLTIDITPSEEGFATIAELFIRQVQSDIKVARLAADRELLASIIEQVAYLATKQRDDLIKRLIEVARG